MSSLGCRSQNILENSIISIRNYMLDQGAFIDLIMMQGIYDKAKDFWQKHKLKILVGASFAAAGYFAVKYFEGEGETKWSSFVEAVRLGKVKEVVVDSDVVFFRSETSEWFKTYSDFIDPSFMWGLVKDKEIIFSQKEDMVPKEVYALLFSAMLSVLSFKYLMGNLNKKDYTPIDLKGSAVDYKTYLDDYYGGEEVKMVFRETIHFLKEPEVYEEMGARIRRGILFYGPPGTGKTMLARALATEAGCQFIRVVASQFQELYVGVGPKRVRELFRAARKFKEGCIIFIDEIDALGSRVSNMQACHETTTTITQFLNEIDGFTVNERVIVIAATNRIDLVDAAVLRSGRFDLKVHIPLPSQEQRKGIIWKILDKRLGFSHSIQQQAVNFVAESCVNWCGADLQSLINESIYRAISENSEKVEDHHLLSSYEEMMELRR